MSSIALIASYPKSGNTWVRKFLTAYIKQKPLSEILNDGSIPLVEGQNVFEMVTNSPFEKDNFERSWGAYCAALGEGKVGTIFKTHLPNGEAGVVPMFPPTTQVVHITRHPLSIVPSLAHYRGLTQAEAFKEMTDRKTTIKSGVQATEITPDPALWVIPMGSWASHTESWLRNTPRSRLLNIRYEDMLKDTETEARKIIRFLRFPYDPDRMAFALSETEFKNLKKVESEQGFAENRARTDGGFFRSGGNECYSPTKKELSRLRRKLLPVMRRLGYNELPG
ncbi:sulfotransferase domain-containing protein [Oceanicaulis alexandrii]|uniref:sulfotransferase domain-containing protein n=1 Tax=Oceanicaulis alexandrii TaxID=153233 RepID=UPI0023554C74|nr:sulfotransferase domain-containing protein [Oceanicaulis alexandrii]